MLRYRLIFGLLFAALLVALIWADSFCASRGYAPAGTFIALATLALVPLAVKEMQSLLARSGVAISMRVSVIACLLCALWPWIEQVADLVNARTLRLAATEPNATAPYNYSNVIGTWFVTVKPHYLVPTVLAAAMLGALVMHSRNQKVHGAMASTGATLLAIVYLGVLPGFFLPICLSYSAWMLLAIIAIVKAADIGAYTVGHLLGRRKLIPWLSPGKTLEGFFGGLLFAGLAGMAAAALNPRFLWHQGLIAGVILGAVGQVGDLLESLLKRDAGVKDSGVLPGFGGLLDLLDSPLLAAPAAYWLLKLLVISKF